MAPMDIMSRSCISSKERAQEVAKRRKEAESERERQRAERLQQIAERSARAAERKQKGMAEKQIKVRTESERLREVNSRRQEHESREQERLKNLLKKKQENNRPVVVLPTKTIAFGSAVPRHTVLSKEPSPMTRSTSIGRTSAPRSSMTSSVHPHLSTSRDRSSIASNGSPKQSASTSSPKQSTPRLPGSAIRSPQRTPVRPPSNTPNRMSRSVHPALCPTPNIQRTSRPQAARPPLPKSAPGVKKSESKGRLLPTTTPTTHKPLVKKTSSAVAQTADIKAPSIPKVESESPQKEAKIAPIVQVEEPLMIVEVKKQVPEEEMDVEVENEKPTEEIQKIVAPIVEMETEATNIEDIVSIEADEPIQLPPVEPQPVHETDDGDSGNASEGAQPMILEPYHTRTVSDSSQKTRTISPISEPEEEEVNSEAVEPLVTSIVDQIVTNVTFTAPSTPQPSNTPVQLDVTSHADSPKIRNGHTPISFHQESTRISEYFSANDQTPDRNEEEKSTTLEADSTANTTVSLGNGVVLGLTEKLQQERDSRQAKLQSLLAKVGQNGGASGGPKPIPETRSTSSSFVKDILAKRSLNQTNGEESDRSFTTPTMSGAASELSANGENGAISLAEEFAKLGMNGNRHSFNLPGQMPDHPVNS